MRTVNAALGVAMLASVFAAASSAQAQLGGDARARAGIERAKAAGIEVDPTVEAAMARAPVGSCPNDPTQPKCPPATKVVASPTATNADGSVSSVWALGDAPTATVARKPIARVAQWPSFCNMWLSDASPYKASGYAQANSTAYCSYVVTALEHYLWLFKRYNNQWYQMAVRARRAPGGEYIHLHATYNCTDNPRRYWRAYAEGWALYNGGWHWASRERFNYLYCG